jgi:hypothetical protein
MAEPAATQADQPQGTLARLGALAWQALPAIAGAVGVLGFVTLVGGGIVWVRFWSAGLPADQAVRAMPRQELITIGAVSLVAFAVAGVLVTLLLYVLDHNGDASVNTFRGLVILALTEWVLTLLTFTELEGTLELALAAWFAAVAVLAYVGFKNAASGFEAARARKQQDEPLLAAWGEFRDADDRHEDARNRMTLSLDAPPLQWPTEHFRRTGAERLREQREWGRALDRWIAALPEGSKAAAEARKLSRQDPPAEPELRKVVEGATAEARAAAGIEDPSSWRKPAGIRRGWVLLSFAVLIPVVWLLAREDGDDEVLLASVAGLIVILAAANFAVARITNRFAWYGVATLVSLVLFGAGANMVKTIREPQVQPVALIRKSDGTAFCGVYGTETDKRLYVGRIQGDLGESEAGADAGAGRMFSVPLDDIEVFSIGSIQDMADADWRARALVAEVTRDKTAKPPAAPPTGKRTTVIRDSRQRRRVKTTTTVEDVPRSPARRQGAGAKKGPAAAPTAPTATPGPPDAMRCRHSDLSEGAAPG